MSLRHALLGLLARQPSNGYELAQMFDRSLRTSWHASHSQIYPELAKLQEAGMVEVIAHGARRSRVWGLTEGGRDELRRWLVEAEPDRSQRNESGLRVFLTPLLPAQERRLVFQRDLAYIEDQLHELHELHEQAAETPIAQPFLAQIDLGLRLNDVTRAWLIDQIKAADG
jgi:PadR family transcriptional regulator AphA